MTLKAKIGIVGGAGWLGRAIATAILEKGLVAPPALSLSYRSAKSKGLEGVEWTTDNQHLADRSDVIILSVRPDDWPALAFDAGDKLVISVMAGIPIAAIMQALGSRRVVRALPNAAAEVGASYTPWTSSVAVGDDDRAIVRAILNACGSEDELATESEIDYLTGLSGTGPAYPALLATALMRDAINRGIDPDVARRAVTALLTGSGRLMEKHGEKPEDIVAAFVNYGGVTAAGIEAMRASGFEAAVSAGLEAALARSLQMAKISS